VWQQLGAKGGRRGVNQPQSCLGKKGRPISKSPHPTGRHEIVKRHGAGQHRNGKGCEKNGGPSCSDASTKPSPSQKKIQLAPKRTSMGGTTRSQDRVSDIEGKSSGGTSRAYGGTAFIHLPLKWIGPGGCGILIGLGKRPSRGFNNSLPNERSQADGPARTACSYRRLDRYYPRRGAGRFENQGLTSGAPRLGPETER